MTGKEWLHDQNAIYLSKVANTKSGGKGWNLPENHLAYGLIDKNQPHALVLVNTPDYVVIDVDDDEANKIISSYLSQPPYDKTPRIQTTRGYHYIFKKNATYLKMRGHEKTKVKTLCLFGVEVDYLCGKRIEILARNEMNEASQVFLHTRPQHFFENEIPDLPFCLTPLINKNNTAIRKDKWEHGLFTSLEVGHRNHTMIMAWLRWLRLSPNYVFEHKDIKEWARACAKHIPNWTTKSLDEFDNDIQDIDNWIAELKLDIPDDMPPAISTTKNLDKYWVLESLLKRKGTQVYSGLTTYWDVYEYLIKKSELAIADDDGQIFALDPLKQVITPVEKLDWVVGRCLYDISSDIAPNLISDITRGLIYEIPILPKVNNDKVVHFKNVDYKYSTGVLPYDDMGEVIKPNQLPHNLITHKTLMSDEYKIYRDSFTEFFNNWTRGDKGVRTELLELIGISMTKYTNHDKAWFLLGEGSNGKSLFLKMLEAILGKWNVSNRDINEISKNTFASSNLYGKIANINSDISGGYIEDTAMFKKLVSGDSVIAERKRQDAFSFRPYATLIFATNSLPYFKESGESSGVDRRIKIIPFLNQLQSNLNISILIEKLLHPKFLEVVIYNAVMATEQAFKRGDLWTSKVSQKYHEDYYIELNNVVGFLSEQEYKSRTPIFTLYSNYKLWADKYKYKSLGYHNFKKQLLKILSGRGWYVDIETDKNNLVGKNQELLILTKE